MQIIITGGGGFLGQKLASALLNSSLAFNELLLVDLKMPARLSDSPRLRCLEADLTQPGVLENVITANTSCCLSSRCDCQQSCGRRFRSGMES